MDKTGYTKGPWHVGAQNDGLFIIDQPPRPAPADHPADIPGVTIIGVVYDNVFDDAGASQGTANARLIAAAPEMFEALQNILLCPAILDELNGDNETNNAVAKARAALSKALGGDR
jgi:hypothetical protein